MKYGKYGTSRKVVYVVSKNGKIIKVLEKNEKEEILLYKFLAEENSNYKVTRKII